MNKLHSVGNCTIPYVWMKKMHIFWLSPIQSNQMSSTGFQPLIQNAQLYKQGQIITHKRWNVINHPYIDSQEHEQQLHTQKTLVVIIAHTLISVNIC